MFRGGVFLAVCLAAALLPGAVRGAVIYTNFGEGDSFLAGSGLIVTHDGAAWSSAAVSFVPAAAYSLTSIEFAGSSLMPGAGAGSLAIFADDGGHPAATALETFELRGELSPFGDAVALLEVRSSLHPLLERGVTYWIGMNAPVGGLAVWNQTASLVSGLAVTDGAGNWSLSSAAQGAVELVGKRVRKTREPVLPLASTDPLPESLFAADRAPEIPAAIPEPGAFRLMGFGLAGALLLTRRPRRQQ
jgi:hypothetical protein